MEATRILEPREEPKPKRKTGFWRRQFARKITRPQIVFDVIFGVIGPILCFVFDPFVFRGGLMGPPMLQEYQTFVYLLSGLQIALLCLWLTTGSGFQLWNYFLSGVLLAGSLFCFTVGLVLLPYSLVGLFFGIGLFGFTPFVSSLVYLRNSERAFRAKIPAASSSVRTASLVFGFVLVFGLPALLSVQINQAVSRAVNEIIHGDPQQAAFAAHRLVPLRFLAGGELDQLVNAYSFEADEKRKEILKSCYREITGEDVETRAQIMAD